MKWVVLAFRRAPIALALVLGPAAAQERLSDRDAPRYTDERLQGAELRRLSQQPFVQFQGEAIREEGPSGRPLKCAVRARVSAPNETVGVEFDAIEYGIELDRSEYLDDDSTVFQGRVYVALRFVDRLTGAPVAAERPVLNPRTGGAVYAWRFSPMDAGGFVRAETPIAELNERSKMDFGDAVASRSRVFVATLPPDGRTWYARISLDVTVPAGDHYAATRCVCALRIDDFSYMACRETGWR